MSGVWKQNVSPAEYRARVQRLVRAREQPAVAGCGSACGSAYSSACSSGSACSSHDAAGMHGGGFFMGRNAEDEDDYEDLATGPAVHNDEEVHDPRMFRAEAFSPRVGGARVSDKLLYQGAPTCQALCSSIQALAKVCVDSGKPCTNIAAVRVHVKDADAIKSYLVPDAVRDADTDSYFLCTSHYNAMNTDAALKKVFKAATVFSLTAAAGVVLGPIAAAGWGLATAALATSVRPLWSKSAMQELRSYFRRHTIADIQREITEKAYTAGGGQEELYMSTTARILGPSESAVHRLAATYGGDTSANARNDLALLHALVPSEKVGMVNVAARASGVPKAVEALQEMLPVLKTVSPSLIAACVNLGVNSANWWRTMQKRASVYDQLVACTLGDCNGKVNVTDEQRSATLDLIAKWVQTTGVRVVFTDESIEALDEDVVKVAEEVYAKYILTDMPRVVASSIQPTLAHANADIIVGGSGRGKGKANAKTGTGIMVQKGKAFIAPPRPTTAAPGLDVSFVTNATPAANAGAGKPEAREPAANAGAGKPVATAVASLPVADAETERLRRIVGEAKANVQLIQRKREEHDANTLAAELSIDMDINRTERELALLQNSLSETRRLARKLEESMRTLTSEQTESARTTHAEYLAMINRYVEQEKALQSKLEKLQSNKKEINKAHPLELKLLRGEMDLANVALKEAEAAYRQRVAKMSVKPVASAASERAERATSEPVETASGPASEPVAASEPEAPAEVTRTVDQANEIATELAALEHNASAAEALRTQQLEALNTDLNANEKELANARKQFQDSSKTLRSSPKPSEEELAGARESIADASNNIETLKAQRKKLVSDIEELKAQRSLAAAEVQDAKEKLSAQLREAQPTLEMHTATAAAVTESTATAAAVAVESTEPVTESTANAGKAKSGRTWSAVAANAGNAKPDQTWSTATVATVESTEPAAEPTATVDSTEPTAEAATGAVANAAENVTRQRENLQHEINELTEQIDQLRDSIRVADDTEKPKLQEQLQAAIMLRSNKVLELSALSRRADEPKPAQAAPLNADVEVEKAKEVVKSATDIIALYETFNNETTRGKKSPEKIKETQEHEAKLLQQRNTVRNLIENVNGLLKSVRKNNKILQPLHKAREKLAASVTEFDAMLNPMINKRAAKAAAKAAADAEVEAKVEAARIENLKREIAELTEQIDQLTGLISTTSGEQRKELMTKIASALALRNQKRAEIGPGFEEPAFDVDEADIDVDFSNESREKIPLAPLITDALFGKTLPNGSDKNLKLGVDKAVEVLKLGAAVEIVKRLGVEPANEQLLMSALMSLTIKSIQNNLNLEYDALQRFIQLVLPSDAPLQARLEAGQRVFKALDSDLAAPITQLLDLLASEKPMFALKRLNVGPRLISGMEKNSTIMQKAVDAALKFAHLEFVNAAVESGIMPKPAVMAVASPPPMKVIKADAPHHTDTEIIDPHRFLTHLLGRSELQELVGEEYISIFSPVIKTRDEIYEMKVESQLQLNDRARAKHLLGFANHVESILKVSEAAATVYAQALALARIALARVTGVGAKLEALRVNAARVPLSLPRQDKVATSQTSIDVLSKGDAARARQLTLLVNTARSFTTLPQWLGLLDTDVEAYQAALPVLLSQASTAFADNHAAGVMNLAKTADFLGLTASDLTDLARLRSRVAPLAAMLDMEVTPHRGLVELIRYNILMLLADGEFRRVFAARAHIHPPSVADMLTPLEREFDHA